MAGALDEILAFEDNEPGEDTSFAMPVDPEETAEPEVTQGAHEELDESSTEDEETDDDSEDDIRQVHALDSYTSF